MNNKPLNMLNIVLGFHHSWWISWVYTCLIFINIGKKTTSQLLFFCVKYNAYYISYLCSKGKGKGDTYKYFFSISLCWKYEFGKYS